jgi:hypothetical protein
MRNFRAGVGTIDDGFGFPATTRHVGPDATLSVTVHVASLRSRGKLLSSGQTPKQPSVKKAADKVSPKGRDTGAALRSVYQRTVDEAVPDDLLDLLGKLS